MIHMEVLLSRDLQYTLCASTLHRGVCTELQCIQSLYNGSDGTLFAQ